jgi:branched-chain amino acid transport system permease protein
MAALLGPILFVVVVVGGLGSLGGAVVATLQIGRLQTVAVATNPTLADLFGGYAFADTLATYLSDIWNVTVAQVAPILPYLLLVLILIFRPRGLMGTRET